MSERQRQTARELADAINADPILAITASVEHGLVGPMVKLRPQRPRKRGGRWLVIAEWGTHLAKRGVPREGWHCTATRVTRCRSLSQARRIGRAARDSGAAVRVRRWRRWLPVVVVG